MGQEQGLESGRAPERGLEQEREPVTVRLRQGVQEQGAPVVRSAQTLPQPEVRVGH